MVPQGSVARVPEGTSLEAAATLPMNGLTVRLALDRLGLKPGQTLAVTGAAGAVGGYAVELGVSDGLRVIARGERDDAPLSLGAREPRKRIVRAAELEGAATLQVLAFEDDFRADARIHGARSHDGRTVSGAGDLTSGVFDVGVCGREHCSPLDSGSGL